MQRHPEQRRGKHTETQPPLAAEPPASVSASFSSNKPSSLVTVLVTPKITFSLPCKAHWKTVEDIEEDALREAFLARFPVRLRADHLSFTCATPSVLLSGQDLLVYRISATGVAEDRVLLSVLSELDKSYSAKFAEQLEHARADCLAASNCFQVSGPPARRIRKVCSRLWCRHASTARALNPRRWLWTRFARLRRVRRAGGRRRCAR